VITIIGCGGTGSQIGHGNAVFAPGAVASGHPYGLRVFLIDGDRNHRNELACGSLSAVRRWAFIRLVVLINRLNMFWGLDLGGRAHFSFAVGRTCPTSDFP